MKKIIICSALISITGLSEAQSLKEAQKLNDNEQYEAAGEMYKQCNRQDDDECRRDPADRRKPF